MPQKAMTVLSPNLIFIRFIQMVAMGMKHIHYAAANELLCTSLF